MNEHFDMFKMRAVAQAMRNDYADRQIHGIIANCSGGRCAIGVVCDLAVMAHPDRFEWRPNGSSMLFYDAETTSLSNGLWPYGLTAHGFTRWLELPVLGEVTLIELNDYGVLAHVEQDDGQIGHVMRYAERQRPLTLPQIADCIDFYLNNLERQEIEVTA